MKYRFIMLCLLALGFVASNASRVDTVMVKSESMKRDIKVVYVVPDAAANGVMRCPVVYLLHGWSGNALSWITLSPELKTEADRLGMIFVCPDGENSWYWDSPTQPKMRFETFVSKELVAYTDAAYPTVALKKARAITGLSMGGHGALWLAFRHKDVYGAVAAMSGGVDIRPFPDSWNMKDQLGEKSQHPDRWDAYTVMTQLDRIQNGDLAIAFDCGTNDFFYPVNLKLHQELLQRKIAHDFTSRPGDHTAAYWQNAIGYHLLFFKDFFYKTERPKV